jgi:AraC-like DNA-binding protein
LLFVPGVLINLTIYFKNLNQILILIHFHEIFYLFNLFLLVYFFKILHVHNSLVKEFYSNIESKTLSWLKLILLIVFFFHFFEFIEALIPTKRADDLEILFSIIYSLIPFSLVYLIGLNGFYQFEIFSGISSNYFIDNFNKNMFVQSKKQSKNDFEQFKQTIIIERLYAKKNLTLYDLSIALKMKKRVISILINDNTDTTFYHFINQLRIKEFKKHLIEDEHQKFTLFGLAQEVGFSSKSTFYTSFKSIEGMTPKQYQSKLKKSVST